MWKEHVMWDMFIEKELNASHVHDLINIFNLLIP